MRKIFGGVTFTLNDTTEQYVVAVKNSDDSLVKLFSERFDRKKAYGVDFVIETAADLLDTPLTEEEIAWYRSADHTELQELILSTTNLE